MIDDQLRVPGPGDAFRAFRGRRGSQRSARVLRPTTDARGPPESGDRAGPPGPSDALVGARPALRPVARRRAGAGRPGHVRRPGQGSRVHAGDRLRAGRRGRGDVRAAVRLQGRRGRGRRRHGAGRWRVHGVRQHRHRRARDRLHGARPAAGRTHRAGDPLRLGLLRHPPHPPRPRLDPRRLIGPGAGHHHAGLPRVRPVPAGDPCGRTGDGDDARREAVGGLPRRRGRAGHPGVRPDRRALRGRAGAGRRALGSHRRLGRGLGGAVHGVRRPPVQRPGRPHRQPRAVRDRAPTAARRGPRHRHGARLRSRAGAGRGPGREPWT